MMVRNDDLGLSLSLGSSQNHRAEPQPSPFILSQRTHWTDLLSCPQGRPPDPFIRPKTTRSGFSPRHSKHSVSESEHTERSPVQLRGIDVNRAPAMERESDEEAGASSPNSTLSSVSGKRGERDRGDELMILGGGAAEELDMERGSSRGGVSDEEDGEGSRKKLRLSKDQSAILEESFKDHSTLNPKQKQALAKQLNLRPRQVEVWFQNRRARTKLKQTEVDCEFLKRCCENLTDENRRLQKEVAELRALKLSPQFYMHMTPPTTLTMCPSCERVAVSNNNNNNTARTGGAAAGGGSPAAAPAAEHHYHHHQRAAFPLAAAAATPTPWAPVPLRSSFVDVHPQRLV